MTRPLELTRAQILAYRRSVQALDERLLASPESLRRAAWAGLQDSMPRAALLSIHARVERTTPSTWEDPSLVQVWGPRFSAYVVAARDVPVFTLGRMPDDAKGRQRAEEAADRLETLLGGERMTYGAAGRALDVIPNSLRYGTTTGRILIRWAGARQPTIRIVPPPVVEPSEARLELARRYLHFFGPTRPAAFAQWAGIGPAEARAAFEALDGSLTPARTPIGDGWILTTDEPTIRAPSEATASARLLPSGDTYYLLQGADRELLVPQADRRRELWTSRVWPGAVLARGEIVGTWRRAGPTVSIQSWRRLTPEERAAVEAEAESLPLPDIQARIRVRWD